MGFFLGPISNKDDSANLEELKETHRIKHHSLEVCFAYFSFILVYILDNLFKMREIFDYPFYYKTKQRNVSIIKVSPLEAFCD